MLLATQDRSEDCADAPFVAGDRRPPLAAAAAYVPQRYGARRRFNWPIAAGIVAAEVLLMAVLTTTGAIRITDTKPPMKVFDVDLSQPVVPPPPPPPAPEVKPVEVTTASPIVAPKPLVETPAPAPQLAASEEPAPAPQPEAPVKAAVPPRPAPPAPSGPVSVGDLSSKMISATPPRYPTESRRKREQGVVVLAVTLAADGSVADVAIRQSSGFDRLDEAARSAVRRWRWSPTTRDGVAVMVRGIVEIPFILKA